MENLAYSVKRIFFIPREYFTLDIDKSITQLHVFWFAYPTVPYLKFEEGTEIETSFVNAKTETLKPFYIGFIQKLEDSKNMVRNEWEKFKI